MKAQSLCKFSPSQPSCRTHFVFRLKLWQSKDRQNDTEKEGGQARAQTQDQPWDIPEQVSGENRTSRTAGACLSHLPCPKCSNPTPNFTHPMAQCCPIPQSLSTTAPTSLGTPQGLLNLGLCFELPLHTHCSPTCWEPGAEPPRHRNVSTSLNSPGLPSQAHSCLQFHF